MGDNEDRFDLVIVGMGSGGVMAADFAAGLGLRLAVVERGRVGGDGLWSGCIPSKSLIAAAKVAHTMRTAGAVGITPVEPEIDTAAVLARIREVQHDIAGTNHDPDHFASMGIEIVHGIASVSGPNEVLVQTGGSAHRALETRFILLCTGSRPAVPEIPGLREVGYLTSDDVFALERAPASLLVLGGGPTGVELAQAFQRLGVQVTLLQEEARLLPRDEPLLVALLHERLTAEGVTVVCDADVRSVTRSVDGTVTAHGSVHGTPQWWSAERILVATGREPNVEGLGLEGLGIEVGPGGVAVDERGRTNVHSIYVAGDLTGQSLFTHAAGYEGVRAVRDAFLPGRGRAPDFVPWCTFTDPELAHAGLTVDEAEHRYGDDVDVWRMDLAHNDRARAEPSGPGAIVVITAKGRIVGAHLLAPGAGEIVHELALAIRAEMRLADVAGLVHIYPTISTSIGQLASEAVYERAAKLRWLVRKGK